MSEPKPALNAGALRWMDCDTDLSAKQMVIDLHVQRALARSGNTIGKTDLRTTLLRNISHLWTPPTAPMMPMKATLQLSALSHEEGTP